MPDNGPPVTRGAFDEIAAQVRNWDRWPHESIQRGSLNHLGAPQVVAAAGSVRSGRCVSIGLPWNVVSAVDNPKPALHYMVDQGDVEQPEPSTNRDFIGVDFHGKSVSHLDALSHTVYEGLLFGGIRSSEAVGSRGASHGAVTHLAPIVGRGLLVDLPLIRRVPWLEPGTAVHWADIVAAERQAGFTIGPGDIVLLRTGHLRRRAELGPWDSDLLSSGWHVDAMPTLHQRRVSVLGADGDSDVRPSPVSSVTSPIHVLTIAMMGVPLLDNLDLEPLAAACAAEGRWEFLFVVSPLNVPGGTGSPVNPVAVF